MDAFFDIHGVPKIKIPAKDSPDPWPPKEAASFNWNTDYNEFKGAFNISGEAAHLSSETLCTAGYLIGSDLAEPSFKDPRFRHEDTISCNSGSWLSHRDNKTDVIDGKDISCGAPWYHISSTSCRGQQRRTAAVVSAGATTVCPIPSSANPFPTKANCHIDVSYGKGAKSHTLITPSEQYKVCMDQCNMNKGCGAFEVSNNKAKKPTCYLWDKTVGTQNPTDGKILTTKGAIRGKEPYSVVRDSKTPAGANIPLDYCYIKQG